ncbi:hypothetical protein FKM82_022752 [Ascaphus truei]
MTGTGSDSEVIREVCDRGKLRLNVLYNRIICSLIWDLNALTLYNNHLSAILSPHRLTDMSDLLYHILLIYSLPNALPTTTLILQLAHEHLLLLPFATRNSHM